LTAASPPARLGLVPKSLDLRGLGTRSLFADLPREFLPQSVSICLRSGIKANSSVRKFPEKDQEIFGFQVLLRWSRVSMEAGCMLMLGGGVFGRGPLGQGATSACRGWWCCLRKAEWVQNRQSCRFFWTLGQGPRRRLSDPERVPWSARTGEEGQS